MSNETNSIILASSSRYRKALLNRLSIAFTCISPDIDESRHDGESPLQLVERLSVEKAQVIAANYPNALVIGSDQLAELNDVVLGKPGSTANAEQQLAACAGQSVRFLTGLHVCRQQDGYAETRVVATEVKFRQLTAEEISRYIAKEQPLDCAGSFKSEALGISLFKELSSPDPTALEGLPLIALCELLRGAKLQLP